MSVTIVRAKQEDLILSESGCQRVPRKNDGVRYWLKHAEKLSGSQIGKARTFVDHNCIQYIGDDLEYKSKYSFICLPLNSEEDVQDIETGRKFTKRPYEVSGRSVNYNSNIYKISKATDKKTFICNCQGWHAKNKRGEIHEGDAGCSHILALFMCFKLRIFGPTKTQFENDE